ncbi:aldo/keto reductase [Tetragenococcus halophilus subsp. flandriensis]|uniref:aldo/keto reductase n=1 Tax=Tetragenococcus halophilus TaxID=51669 RepID=UPI0023EA2F5A|nr:aldo/keto reductase [Tetragenococcus halophilus]GMA08157.1 aldo/keto reductase [Tetragenococcus halophilus subsp. flandriensis]
MNKRKIGNLEVSPIGMGCMGFSHGYGQVPEESYSIEAIKKAYEFGCTFFDTAEVYGQERFYPGHNEQLVGKAVAPFRENIVLATKLHIDENELSDETDLYTVIRKHLEASLKNLGTDYVDLYYLHRVNEFISIEDIAKVMGQLIDEGLIKEWGLSQVSVDILAKAHNVTPVAAVQNLYSMMERDCEDEIFPYCLEHGISVVPFSPIASGFLSGKVTTETKFEGDDVRKFVPQLSKENIIANQPILDILEKIAEEKGASKAQISLAWMLHKYPNVIPIPGSKSQKRILENLAAWNVELTDKEFESIESALNKITVHGHRGHVETQQATFGNNWKSKK